MVTDSEKPSESRPTSDTAVDEANVTKATPPIAPPVSNETSTDEAPSTEFKGKEIPKSSVVAEESSKPGPKSTVRSIPSIIPVATSRVKKNRLSSKRRQALKTGTQSDSGQTCEPPTQRQRVDTMPTAKDSADGGMQELLGLVQHMKEELDRVREDMRDLRGFVRYVSNGQLGRDSSSSEAWRPARRYSRQGRRY